MRAFITFFLVLGCISPSFAESNESALKEARTRWLRGNYAEARAGYEKLLEDKELRPAAIVGIARTWQSVGEHRKALNVLAAELNREKTDVHPDVLALQAELLYQRGKWSDAMDSAEAALTKDADHFLARWVRARILRDQGEIDKADTEMRWFVRTYTRRSFNDDDIKDPDKLLIVGQAGAENARWHRLSDQFSFILNEIYSDVLKFDPDVWQAEYLAGMMLQEKYNRPDALDAFDKALKINPQAAEAYVGKGISAIQRMEMKDAERFADDALNINPNLVSALRLKADVRLAAGELGESLKLLDRAREINPRDEATLARIAACHHLSRDEAEFEKIVKEVKSFDAKPGVFYFELGEVLNDKRLYTTAEGFYETAAKLRPHLLGPRGSLGLLYMRLGDEPKAKEVLEEAFRADPFNVRVANSLKVLRHLDDYKTLKTEHFDLRYDAQTDQLLAEILADYLEEVYARLTKQFGYSPAERILIEIFNNHEMFSGRTVALPDLHTIGACTGKVVTMVSPNGKGVPRQFNWGRVIRHELTHIFNLAQTDFRVPHWFTEGLAVRNEGFARPEEWSYLLAERLEKDDLLNLDTILLGFIRPRSHEEWSLAYCQSELYIAYLIENFGPEVIGKLLDEFRTGVTTKVALQRVCGIEQPEFERGYRRYLEEVAEPYKLGTDRDGPITLAELEKGHRANPDDPEIAARLAYQYLRRKRPDEAKELAEKILEAEKHQPLATVVLARLLVREKEEEKGRSLLIAARKTYPDDPRLLRELARRHISDGELAEAATLLEHGRKVAPNAGGWLENLVIIYTKIKRTEPLVDILRELAHRNAEDFEARIRLAELLLELGRHGEAEQAAFEALQIDVQDKKAQRALVEALMGQGKQAEADKWKKRFGG